MSIPECFTEEFAYHERNGTLAPSGRVRDAREDPDYFDDVPPGAEVMIPGAFLDQHANAPGNCSDELAAFLQAARPFVHGRPPLARINIPVTLLAPLAEYARDRLMSWNQKQHDVMAMRAAHILACHARGIMRREDELARLAAEPEPRPGHSPGCIVDHPSVPYCPPF